MGGHKTISGSSYPTPAPIPPPPIADYNVTGNPNPDCKCNYFLAGTYNGYPYYRRQDGVYVIWYYEPSEIWFISITLGSLIPAYWVSPSSNIVDTYDPAIPYTGHPIVSAGPH